MNENYNKQFEDWKKKQGFFFTYLRERTGKYIEDIEEMCCRAFEAGLNSCTKPIKKRDND